MHITIHDDSPMPVYRQIIMQVLAGVSKQKIGHNGPLPTIRQLASDLNLTNTTVAKAYQILERSKIIVTSGRRGTFVHEDAQENALRYMKEEFRGQTKDFVSMQLKYGATIDDIEKSLQAVIQEIREKGGTCL